MPESHKFQEAVERFGYKLMWFDFSRLADGTVIVWEAEPYAFYSFDYPYEPSPARNAVTHRIFALMAQTWMSGSGLPVPSQIEELLSEDSAVSAKAQRGLHVIANR